MSRSSTQKTTTAAPAAALRARTAAPLRRTGTTSKSAAAHLTSQRIATDLASFKKSGGRIEVLGNTPLRPYTSRTTSRKTAAKTETETAAPAAAPAAKAKK